MKSQSNQYDVLIVGAGISGATLAERFANEGKKRVLIIDKRDHIGGNCYDYFDDAGILVPKYGPHFFHTNDNEVWDYVNKWSEWIPYEHRVLSNVEGQTLVSVPVNISTINKLFKTKIKTEKGMKTWLKRNTLKIKNPKNSEEVALNRVGKELYEKLFKGYTFKQWDLYPKDLNPSVMARIPVRTTFDDRYFSDTHQAMPKNGYTQLFHNMLQNPLITLQLGVDYFSSEYQHHSFDKIIFTGRIDVFFSSLGHDPLQYRSLRFEYETFNIEYYQSHAQINYPNSEKYTRITEPKHATGQKSDHTTIIKEFPTWDGEPYYPVPSKKNEQLYNKYKREADKLQKNGLHLVGRLAQYKYFNMDQAFRNALNIYEEIKNETTKTK